MQNSCTGIIPARFASSRFPGKPLVEIHGKTMIQRVYEQASKCGRLKQVIVATDDERIFDEISRFGGHVVMTSGHHQSGTDRCAEVAKHLALQADDVIINIQGDEPFIDPVQISHLCECFDNPQVNLATLVKSFYSASEIPDPNSIKVVCDKNGYALYFSRLPIPFQRDENEGAFKLENFVRHIGIYGYRAGTLAELAALQPSFLETSEKLEQLRWLENGYKIMTARSEHESWSIDTPEDLEKVKQHFGKP
ncbi:MAG: 3-deoxy-manno-octulosonate cytidylyltransferase [Bacteroidetes bacterium]|nr:3-deoxy-manno-octulosonate cytidylyltransferase [Bacteroidota bacterium]